MNSVKVNEAIEVIEGQLSCIKEVLSLQDETPIHPMNQQMIIQSLRMIVLSAEEATKKLDFIQ